MIWGGGWECVDVPLSAVIRLQVPDLFLGTIIIPIVGNAAEHAAAIIFAVKNKMELSLGIAVGSATQIALLVVPLCVIVAWLFDLPLSLDFHPFETGCLVLTVLLVTFITQEGGGGRGGRGSGSGINFDPIVIVSVIMIVILFIIIIITVTLAIVLRRRVIT